MAWMSGVVRAGVKAGIAKKVLDELRKPENQQKLKAIAARVVTEVRKPENQERARQVGRTVVRTVRRRRPARP
jgi:hypothetical protein